VRRSRICRSVIVKPHGAACLRVSPEGKEFFMARVDHALFVAKRDADDGLSGVRVRVR
jgi:hypothetical protein